MKEFTKISLHNHVGGDNADKKINNNVVSDVSIDYNIAIRQIDELYKNGNKLIAITNANNINTELMYLMQYYCKTREYDMTILAGAELNLYNDGKILHICIILDNNNASIYKVQGILESFIIENKKNYITYNQLLEILVNSSYKIKTLLSPHGLKQSSRSLENNSVHISELRQMDSNLIPILIEDNKQFHKQVLLDRLKNLLCESDYEWLELSESVSANDRGNTEIEPTLVWCENNFNDLYYSSIMKKSRFYRENDLQEKVDYISRIELEFNGESVGEFKLSHGLNAIVGDSGSGKTLLLNWIYKTLSGENISCSASSITNSYDEIYNTGQIKLFNKSNEELNLDEIEVYHGDNLYNKIVSLFSEDKSNIVSILGGEIDSSDFIIEISKVNKYIDKYIKNRVHQKQLKNIFTKKYKSILEITLELKKVNKHSSNIPPLNEIDINNKINNIIINRNEVHRMAEETKNAIKILSEVLTKYNMPLDAMLNFIKITMMKMMKKKYIILTKEKKKLEMDLIKIIELNRSIDIYNNNIGRSNTRFNEMKKQIDADVVATSNAILELYILIKKEKMFYRNYEKPNLETLKLNSDSELNLNYLNKKSVIPLEDFGELIVKGYSAKLRKKEATLTSAQLKENGIESLNLQTAEDIIKFCDLIVDKNYENFDKNYIKFELSDRYEYYLKIMVQVLNVDTNKFVDINTLSAGQLGKYYIEKMLSREILEKAPNKKLIVFFDQPDNSIGKKFILESLVSKLSELKLDYQVIITTHEPLLVINADANCIIHAKNDKTVSEGNKFKFSRIDITSNIEDAEDVILKISELVDGSHEAVKKRNNIYEGMKYGN